MTTAPSFTGAIVFHVNGRTYSHGQIEAALASSQLLVDAYKQGEGHGGSMDWDDVDQAHEQALIAQGLVSAPASESQG